MQNVAAFILMNAVPLVSAHIHISILIITDAFFHTHAVVSATCSSPTSEPGEPGNQHT